MVTATDVQGEVKRQGKVANDQGLEFSCDLGDPVQVASVAPRNRYWLHDLLEESGLDVKLSHSLKKKAIAAARVKNDKVDSSVLAHLLTASLLAFSINGLGLMTCCCRSSITGLSSCHFVR